MTAVEYRRVQLTGRSTYIISLPKEWARGVGLKPGHTVALIQQADSSLLLVPRGDVKVEARPEALVEVHPSVDPGASIRTFISHYLAGCDFIRVRFHHGTLQHRALLKEVIKRKLIGLEIVEESADEILTQCLIGHSELPLKRAVNRMSTIARSMYSDALAAYSSADHSLAAEVMARDDEVDRFYFFIVRQLKTAVQNRPLIEEIGLRGPKDCLGYRLVAKSIERVADHSARVASLTLGLDRRLDPEVVGGVLEVGELAGRAYSKAMEALEALDVEGANSSIGLSAETVEASRREAERLASLNLAPRYVVNLSLALDSLRRVAEYGADIAEVAVNLAVSSPGPRC
ncbi:MAG: PhoU domain-containing protein [Candidatus Nezhaarchaeales archaeon]